MTWWRRLWNRRALDTQLDEELRFHIEQHAADLIAQGIDPVEAQRRARLEIGGPEQVKEQCRDTRGTRWLDDLTQDARYGLRSLRQRLGFTMVTVSTLALGIGATTVMFTVINSVLLRPYAYPEPDRLVSVIEQTDFSTQYGNQWAFAYPNYQLGYSTTASIPKPTEQPIALATSVSPDYLAVMGMRLRAGRFFDTRDRAGSQPAIVVDDTLAQTAFGTTDIVGRQLWVPDLAPGPFEIVGVVGHVRHWGLGSDDQATVRAQLYYPFAQLPDRYVRRWSELMSIAVRTTVPSPTLVEPLRRALRGGSRDQVLYEVRTLEELAAGTIARQRFLLLLFGVFAGLALLLASLGIYGVLAYLTSQRVPEIGVRMALGASSGDVVRLVLRQSAAMVAGGVIVGAVGAVAAARVLRALVDGVSVDPITFVIMIGVLVAAAMTASAVPAWRACRVDATTALRQE